MDFLLRQTKDENGKEYPQVRCKESSHSMQSVLRASVRYAPPRPSLSQSANAFLHRSLPSALGSGHSRAPCLGLPPPPRGLVLSSSVAPLLLAGFWASLSLRRCLPIRWDYIKSVEVFSRRVLHQQSQSIYTKRVKMSLVVQEQGSFQHILRYVSIS